MVADVAAQKVDIVKIRVDDNLGTTPKMPPEVYRAVIDEAHKREPARRRPPVLSGGRQERARRRRGLHRAQRAGRSTSTPRSSRRSSAQGICLCPTLMREVSTFVYESTPPFFSDPLFLAHADTAQVATLQGAGAAGGDAQEHERAALQGGARGGEPERQDACPTPAFRLRWGPTPARPDGSRATSS